MPDTIRGALKAQLLAADSDPLEGRFRALVSAYGVKYRIGYALWHTIETGAFAGSIAEQPAIPIYQMHSWSWSELPPIGHGTPSESDGDGGLIVDGELYVEESEQARVIARAMKAGAMREWSIGYSVLATRRDPDDDMHEFVTEAELLEASSVLRGANPATQTLEVASRPGIHSITTASGIHVETADADLVARLAGAGAPPAPVEPAEVADPETVTFDPSPLLARAKVRQMFGSTALAD